jgi:hypothetical protein
MDPTPRGVAQDAFLPTPHPRLRTRSPVSDPPQRSRPPQMQGVSHAAPGGSGWTAPNLGNRSRRHAIGPTFASVAWHSQRTVSARLEGIASSPRATRLSDSGTKRSRCALAVPGKTAERGARQKPAAGRPSQTRRPATSARATFGTGRPASRRGRPSHLTRLEV